MSNHFGYRFTRTLINLIINLTTHVESLGRELLPDEGGYVIASNHIGRLDALFVYYYINREDIIMLVAEKYRKIPLIPWLVKQVDGIWVDRFNADVGAMRQALRRLRSGGVLVLAPEGTRSKEGVLQEGRAGVSYLAAKTGMQIFPVGIIGSEDRNVVAHLKRLRRTDVTIITGRPFTLPPLKGNDREEMLQEYTDEIMCRIAALLPPSYHGVYADHPRLKEIMTEQAQMTGS